MDARGVVLHGCMCSPAASLNVSPGDIPSVLPAGFAPRSNPLRPHARGGEEEAGGGADSERDQLPEPAGGRPESFLQAHLQCLPEKLQHDQKEGERYLDREGQQHPSKFPPWGRGAVLLYQLPAAAGWDIHILPLAGRIPTALQTRAAVGGCRVPGQVSLAELVLRVPTAGS